MSDFEIKDRRHAKVTINEAKPLYPRARVPEDEDDRDLVELMTRSMWKLVFGTEIGNRRKFKEE